MKNSPSIHAGWRGTVPTPQTTKPPGARRCGRPPGVLSLGVHACALRGRSCYFTAPSWPAWRLSSRSMISFNCPAMAA